MKEKSLNCRSHRWSSSLNKSGSLSHNLKLNFNTFTSVVIIPGSVWTLLQAFPITWVELFSRAWQVAWSACGWGCAVPTCLITPCRLLIYTLTDFTLVRIRSRWTHSKARSISGIVIGEVRTGVTGKTERHWRACLAWRRAIYWWEEITNANIIAGVLACRTSNTCSIQDYWSSGAGETVRGQLAIARSTRGVAG